MAASSACSAHRVRMPRPLWSAASSLLGKRAPRRFSTLDAESDDALLLSRDSLISPMTNLACELPPLRIVSAKGHHIMDDKGKTYFEGAQFISPLSHGCVFDASYEPLTLPLCRSSAGVHLCAIGTWLAHWRSIKHAICICIIDEGHEVRAPLMRAPLNLYIFLRAGMSGLWCVALGWGNEELIEAASSQMRTLAYYHGFTNRRVPVVDELADALVARAPSRLQHGRVFFGQSGSDANDTQVVAAAVAAAIAAAAAAFAAAFAVDSNLSGPV
eukprot:6207835-Pleurochrysis_carterae.AAC.3